MSYKYPNLFAVHERRLVTYIRGDFARGQRRDKIAVENAIIPLGSFGDVER